MPPISEIFNAGSAGTIITELKKKSFGALFEMARTQAAANGLTEDEVEDEIAACRRARRMRRTPSEKTSV